MPLQCWMSAVTLISRTWSLMKKVRRLVLDRLLNRFTDRMSHRSEHLVVSHKPLFLRWRKMISQTMAHRFYGCTANSDVHWTWCEQTIMSRRHDRYWKRLMPNLSTASILHWRANDIHHPANHSEGWLHGRNQHLHDRIWWHLSPRIDMNLSLVTSERNLWGWIVERRYYRR